jgi:beta-glucanase (GH16 family)
MKTELFPPSNYNLVFEDTFKVPTLNLENWLPRQPWGNIHGSHPHQYYDKDCIEISHEELNLLQKYKPALITHHSGYVYSSSYAIGLVSSRKSWKYGWFEFEAMLPTGRGLWPAMWLTGVHNWPPEIDIMEGYTRRNTNYNTFFTCTKKQIQTNLHYRLPQENYNRDIGPLSHKFSLEPTNNFIKYTCHWTENFIHIYYQEKLVRKITESSILNTLSEPMYILLNNGVERKYNNKIPSQQVSEFKIKSVKVYQSTLV